jgi:signal transduction histidine kinase
MRLLDGRSKGVLGSRVGRRLLGLFLGCALAPLLAFTLLSVAGVSHELGKQLEHSLHQSSKAAGMHVARSLLFSRDHLDLVREPLATEIGLEAAVSPAVARQLGKVFSGVRLEHPSGTLLLAGEDPVVMPVLDAKQLAHLTRGEHLVVVGDRAGRPAMLMACRLQPTDEASPLLVGELRPEVLWDINSIQVPGGDVLVLDGRAHLLTASTVEALDFGRLWAQVGKDPASGTIEWQLAGEENVARYWRVFMRPQFGIDFVIVQSRSRAVALSALHSFVSWFALVGLLTVLVVVFAAVVQIRRVVEPVVDLDLATRRVARGDFGVRLSARGRDEIAGLGRAFNHMAEQLHENIRQREATERDLIAARDMALEAARAKSDFVTSVSHELRTPLTSILGSAEILAQHDDDEAARGEFLGMITEASKHLAELIDDILELSAPGSVEEAAVSLVAPLREAVADVVEQRCPVRIDVPADLTVRGDVRRLADVFRHVLDNAVKFGGEDNEVSIRAWRDGGVVEVAITDRGEGISPDQVGRVFEPFAQVGRNILTEKASGAGLGLTLSRSLLERMGGGIRLESVPGQGTTVVVTLKAAPVEVAPPVSGPVSS